MDTLERVWLHMLLRVKRFFSPQKGQNTTEYILILALIAAAAVATITLFGGKLREWWQKVMNLLGGGIDSGVSTGSGQ